MRRMTLLSLATVMMLTVPGSLRAADDELAAVRSAFEDAVGALNSGSLDGFLDTVHEDALSFYSCGPTSGKQGREACALDWQLFFNTTTNARFETKNEQYRVIGDTGIAYGEYSLSVDYNSQGRQTVHEGRYTMTYTDDLYEGRWRMAHRHAAQHPGRRGSAAGAQLAS